MSAKAAGRVGKYTRPPQGEQLFKQKAAARTDRVLAGSTQVMNVHIGTVSRMQASITQTLITGIQSSN